MLRLGHLGCYLVPLPKSSACMNCVFAELMRWKREHQKHKNREYHRRFYQKMRQDPERYARYLLQKRTDMKNNRAARKQ